MDVEMEQRHLAREVKTALEIAIVALAPSEMIDRLALAAGLLEALGEIPSGSPPAVALAPKTIDRAKRAISEWRRWEHLSLKKVSA